MFKISNLILGGEAIVTNLYTSLQGESDRGTETVIGRERERDSRPRGDCPSYDTETAISEPIETNYLKF
jgi:hypothetical protein